MITKILVLLLLLALAGILIAAGLGMRRIGRSFWLAIVPYLGDITMLDKLGKSRSWAWLLIIPLLGIGAYFGLRAEFANKVLRAPPHSPDTTSQA